MESCRTKRIVVMKFGGSVLADDESYFRAARFVVRRLHECSAERFLVVVSAQKGVTDDLERLAREIASCPGQRTLDLLWATGELRSVALLTLHLEEMGVTTVGFNIHEAGLRLGGRNSSHFRVTSLSTELWRTFDDCSVVVAPGFFATLVNGMIVSLGRGGSDLSAVLLADALDAERCELIKDVPGYFTHDPNLDCKATHLPSLSYAQALAMADMGCELVQQRALEAARKAGLRIVVRGLAEDAPRSVLS
jgi:aspartate kinase